MDSFLGNRLANIKIATLVVGVINLGFTGHSYLKVGAEETYLSAVIICFIVTFVWTVAVIAGLLNQEDEMPRKADMLWHMIACVFYLIALICWFSSLVKYGDDARWLWERIIAFILGVVNTILYGLGGYMFYRT